MPTCVSKSCRPAARSWARARRRASRARPPQQQPAASSSLRAAPSSARASLARPPRALLRWRVVAATAPQRRSSSSSRAARRPQQLSSSRCLTRRRPRTDWWFKSSCHGVGWLLAAGLACVDARVCLVRLVAVCRCWDRSALAGPARGGTARACVQVVFERKQQTFVAACAGGRYWCGGWLNVCVRHFNSASIVPRGFFVWAHSRMSVVMCRRTGQGGTGEGEGAMWPPTHVQAVQDERTCNQSRLQALATSKQRWLPRGCWCSWWGR